MLNEKLCFYKIAFILLWMCCFITYIEGLAITYVVSQVKQEFKRTPWSSMSLFLAVFTADFYPEAT